MVSLKREALAGRESGCLDRLGDLPGSLAVSQR